MQHASSIFYIQYRLHKSNGHSHFEGLYDDIKRCICALRRHGEARLGPPGRIHDEARVGLPELTHLQSFITKMIDEKTMEA